MNSEAVNRVLISLRGLSVGDAFGQKLMLSLNARRLFEARRAPSPPWYYTDDTELALSLVNVLIRKGCVDQDLLAYSFARRCDPSRGYGAAMPGLFRRIRKGESWRAASRALFNGQGSFGNGSAMRVGPLGAFFCGDLQSVVSQARLSAEVTHAHPEAAAGAVAVAVAAALAAMAREQNDVPDPVDFLNEVQSYVPESEVYSGIGVAQTIAPHTNIMEVAAQLGNGSLVTCQDTVPFAIWSAARSLDDFRKALWETASVGGDVDTTCAIVGGIVVSCVGLEGIPEDWLEATEKLPEWVTDNNSYDPVP